MTPAELHRERDELLEEIAAAFRDVSRADGVSWGQAEALDGGPVSQDDRARAARHDRDTHWMQVLDSERNWQPDVGANFCFLDPIGFRYYLPAAMALSIRAGHDRGIQFHLTVAHPGRPSGQRSIQRLSLLDASQTACVRRFILYMMESALLVGDESEAEAWFAACTSYWEKVPESGNPR